jgi:DNA-binding protein H-NS
MDDREVIDYFHIELETHQVVFAEGAPAETLLVTSDHEDFPNFVEYERLYGADERRPMKPFAPTIKYKGGRGEVERLLRLPMESNDLSGRGKQPRWVNVQLLAGKKLDRLLSSLVAFGLPYGAA